MMDDILVSPSFSSVPYAVVLDGHGKRGAWVVEKTKKVILTNVCMFPLSPLLFFLSPSSPPLRRQRPRLLYNQQRRSSARPSSLRTPTSARTGEPRTPPRRRIRFRRPASRRNRFLLVGPRTRSCPETHIQSCALAASFATARQWSRTTCWSCAPGARGWPRMT